MGFNHDCAISSLNGNHLKLVDHLGSNISSTESDVNIRIGKAWTASARLTTILKSDKKKAIVVSVLLYSCTTCNSTKWPEKKLVGELH